MELIIAIGIMVLLTGAVLANYKSNDKDLALQRSANKLAQDIRRTEGMAMSAKISQKVPGAPKGGYGLYFQKDEETYKIYADDGNEQYSGGDTDEEVIALERGIYIKDTNPSSANFSINFKAPDPIIRIKDAAGADKDYTEIILALRTDANKTRTVLVNKTGLIKVIQ